MVTKLWWSHKNELSFNIPSHMVLSKCTKPQERKERLCGMIVRRNLIIIIDIERPIPIVKEPCLAGDSGLLSVDWELAEPCSSNIHSCPPCYVLIVNAVWPAASSFCPIHFSVMVDYWNLELSGRVNPFTPVVLLSVLY